MFKMFRILIFAYILLKYSQFAQVPFDNRSQKLAANEYNSNNHLRTERRTDRLLAPPLLHNHSRLADPEAHVCCPSNSIGDRRFHHLRVQMICNMKSALFMKWKTYNAERHLWIQSRELYTGRRVAIRDWEFSSAEDCRPNVAWLSFRFFVVMEGPGYWRRFCAW